MSNEDLDIFNYGMGVSDYTSRKKRSANTAVKYTLFSCICVQNT